MDTLLQYETSMDTLLQHEAKRLKAEKIRKAIPKLFILSFNMYVLPPESNSLLAY